LKETSFIEQNKQKWNRFEQLYDSKSHDPEELSDLYMDITDDLSYAQTFYRRRTVRVYLNQLAQRVYTGVHKQKGESLRKFFTVWKTSLPLEIYRARKSLLVALVSFVIYVAIGVLTTHIDPDFTRLVLGDGYVDLTNQNIANGNPLAIYGMTESQLQMFMDITTNNMKVAFLTFFLGFFFTLGTHLVIFYNGVMLGTFQYFFHTKGLLITSFLGIWIHGAFEISAIVLAAGAGITAGNGWLFPKSYTRLQSLQLSTKRGLKIMMSLVPFIIAAGFLESYVTHNYQNLPDWSKWALILLSFAIILGYYVFYPVYVARKHPELLHEEQVGNFKPKTTFNFNKIRGIGETLADSFRMYRLQFGKIMRVIMLLVFPLVAGLVAFQDMSHLEMQQQEHWYDWRTQFELMMGYGYRNPSDLVAILGWTIVFTLICASVFWSIRTMKEVFSWKSFFSYVARRGLGIWLANFFILIIAFTLPWWGILLCFFLIPLFFLVSATVGLDDGKFGFRMGRGFKFSSRQYGNNLLMLFILLVFVTILMQPIASVFSIHDGWSGSGPVIMSDLLDLVAGFVKRIAMAVNGDYMFWGNVTRQLVYVLFILMFLPLAVIVTSFGFYSERERSEATGLKEDFKKFGKRSRTKETNADFE
jgi:uncharacterized membrane protein SpoIIM required for sporulation